MSKVIKCIKLFKLYLALLDCMRDVGLQKTINDVEQFAAVVLVFARFHETQRTALNRLIFVKICTNTAALSFADLWVDASGHVHWSFGTSVPLPLLQAALI